MVNGPFAANVGFFFSSRRRHTRSLRHWSSDVCSSDLQRTIERLNGLGGAVVFEDYPGALEEDGQGDAGGNAVSPAEERERRGRLNYRVDRLAEAIERVRAGDYGVCEICGDPIAAGRLRAIPEATT